MSDKSWPPRANMPKNRLIEGIVGHVISEWYCALNDPKKAHLPPNDRNRLAVMIAHKVETLMRDAKAEAFEDAANMLLCKCKFDHICEKHRLLYKSAKAIRGGDEK